MFELYFGDEGVEKRNSDIDGLFILDLRTSGLPELEETRLLTSYCYAMLRVILTRIRLMKILHWSCSPALFAK